MEENKEAYNSIDSDTRELLEVVAKVKIPEEYKVMKNGGERFEMCKAFEDYRLEGKLEEEFPEIERIIAAQQRVGSYDVEQICRVLA